MVTPLEVPGIEMKQNGQNGRSEQKEKLMANFEEAITLAGNGKFQFRAMMGSGLCMYAILCESVSVAYVLPSAQCDLNMTFGEKGILSATIFIGFICSAYLWGAVGDICGRRSVMMLALLGSSISTLISSVMPTFIPLLIFRFISGFLVCAPSGLLYVYAGEFFNNSNRPRAILIVASIGAISTISIPAMALAIIPSGWSIPIPYLPALQSWRLFMATCALPSIIASFVLKTGMPESPKFLLENGKHHEALMVLRQVYASNTGKSKEDYPVYALISDKEECASPEDEPNNPEIKASVLSLMWRQTAPLLSRHLRGKTVLASLMMFAAFFGFNPLILWLPELFNRLSVHEAGSVSLCDVMTSVDHDFNSTLVLFEEGIAAAGDAANIFPLDLLEYNVTALEEGETCDSSVDTSAFMNSVLLNAAAAAANVFSSLAINTLGKKKLLVAWFMIAGVLTATLPYLKDPTLLLVLYCVGVAVGCACPGIILAVAIDIFPTNVRGMATSIAMMLGRVGIVCGTMVFGTLLELQCTIPFFLLSGGLIGGALLAMQLPSR